MKRLCKKTFSFENFKKFLEENNAFDKYILNIKRRFPQFTLQSDKDISVFLEKFLLLETERAISGAFTWSNTEEGRVFWEELDTKLLEQFKDGDDQGEEKSYFTFTDIEHFLKQHDAFDKYVNNFLKEHPISSLNSDIVKMIRERDMDDIYFIISAAFLWSDTPEGYEYWEDLNRKLWKWYQEMGVEIKILLD